MNEDYNKQIVLKIKKNSFGKNKIYITTIIFMISLFFLTEKSFVISSSNTINNCYFVLVNIARYSLLFIWFAMFIKTKSIKEHGSRYFKRIISDDF